MTSLHKYLILSLLWVFPTVCAQLPHGGKPYPYSGLKSTVKPIVISGFEIQKAIGESLSDDAISGKKPFKFAWNYPLELSPENSGAWTEMQDGTRVWRICFLAPGAFGVNIDFSIFQLKPGCSIFIYPPSQELFLGGFNYRNNNESGTLPTEFIKGEEIVIELQTIPGMIDYGSLQIGTLSHAYIDIFSRKAASSSLSGSCEIDINCPDGNDWQQIKKAVCRITFNMGSSKEFCTGTLINNTREDTIPYLLTANHCIRTVSQAATALFKFDYELDTCGKKTILASYSLIGSTLLATSDSIDFTLLRLNDTIPEMYKPYYSGWSISTTPATNATCIHHPQGDVKKISIENNSLTSEYQNPIPANLSWLYNQSLPGAFWRVTNWEKGTTEGGSSGSPLFNQNKLIVGNLTGGEASCLNPVNDYFSKFYIGWDYYSLISKQLKHWLDPDNTGVINLTGFNPYGPPQNTVIYPARFTLYPNPTTGIVTFETDSQDISGGTISIYNLTGEKLAYYKIVDSPALILDVSFLDQGLYILDFSKGNIHERRRLLVINLQK